MSIIVPSVGEVKTLQRMLSVNMSLRLYSNNYTPVEGTTLANFTEVAGGGYVSKTLQTASWGYTTGDPSFALYAAQDFTFTGPTNAPGTIYGYYVVDPDGVVIWAERFPEGSLPFSPILNSLVRITPRIEGS